MGADANRAAAADRSPPTAKRGRLSERAWTDILRGARLARAEGVELLMHGVKITGTRKPSPVKMASCKGLQQPVEPAVPKPPLAKADDASPPPLSKREERSARRLQVFQQKKRAEIFAARYGGSTSGKSADRHEQIYQRKGWHPALARAKLRAMLWRCFECANFLKDKRLTMAQLCADCARWPHGKQRTPWAGTHVSARFCGRLFLVDWKGS